MMASLLLFITLLLCIFASLALAFRSLEKKSKAKTFFVTSRASLSQGIVGSTMIASTTTKALATKTTTTTKLRASLQFKNVEQMLENFGNQPLLIVFTAMNCGPCKLLRKELVSVVQKENLPNWTMVSIDTDRWPNVGSRFHVGKLPCLVAVKDGEELLRLEGLKTADEIVSNIRSLT